MDQESRTAHVLVGLDARRWADSSERILRARDNIDKLVASAKGQDFVDRMLESLPRLGPSGNGARGGADEKAICALCAP